MPKPTDEDMRRAREAIKDAKKLGCDWEEWLEENMAKLIADEREACARVAERYPRRINHTEEATGLSYAPYNIAEVVRHEVHFADLKGESDGTC